MQRSSDLQTLVQLTREARPFWPQLGLIFVLSLLAVPLSLLLPLPFKIVVDSVLGGAPLPAALAALVPTAFSDAPGAVLGLAAGLLVAVTVLSHLEGFASWLLQSYTGEQLVLRARARLFEHAQRLSIAHHDRSGSAEALYRIHDDSVPAQYITVSGLVPLLSSACVLVGLVAVTAWLDATLAAIALVVVPVLVALTEFYRRRVRAGWSEVRSLDAAAQSILQEVLGALRVVKAFGQERREQERYVHHASRAMKQQLRVIAGEATFGLLVALTLAVGSALVLYVGVRHVQAGLLSLGDLLLVTGYLAQLYKPVENISKKVTSLQGALASADRIAALTREPLEVPEHPAPRRLPRAKGAFELHGVTFGYDDAPPVLRDVSLAIPRGARVGIVGETGAGKSTLVHLLMRFFDPRAGSIRLDGIDLRELALADLRKQFAIVLQEPLLFSTTIADNIGYGRADARLEDIMAAARAANAHEFIAGLPNGYQTRVGERGMTLSGGERQRIALARAFLKDAPVLILDEPTSAIDGKNEREILDALDRLIRGRTTFIIAHRLNTLDGCDLRLRIERGTIAVESAEPADSNRPSVGFESGSAQPQTVERA